MTHELLMVNDANLNEAVLENEKTVILAIGAEWCPDCRRAAPFFMQFAKTYADKAVFGRADSEQSPKVVEQFAVEHIPTMVVVKNGKEVDRVVEVKSPAELKDFIERNL